MNSAKRPSVVFNLTCNNMEKGDDHETVDTVISDPHQHPRASIFSNISNGLISLRRLSRISDFSFSSSISNVYVWNYRRLFLFIFFSLTLLAVFVYLFVIIMLPKFEHDEDLFQLFKI